jgi:cell division protein FtsI (penicillin-binding protein 3)
MARPSRKKQHSAHFGDPATASQRWRLVFIKWAFILALSLIAARLVMLQTHPDLRLSKQDLRRIGNKPLLAPRGNIYDRRMRLLATDAKLSTLTAHPQKVDDAEALAAAIHQRIGLDKATVIAKLSRVDRQALYIKRWLTPQERDALGDLESWAGAALRLEPEPVRSYPEGGVASHVLGYVNREQVGSAGLELAYDKYLQSTPGHYEARRDGNRRLMLSRTSAYKEPKHGGHLILTLDSVIQANLEQALDTRMEEVGAVRAMGVIMDPKTGAILALASRPAFDPNRFWEADDEARKNHAITDVFEPGSVFKIVAAAAALEHELITAETEIDCENGVMRIGRRRIHDYHPLGLEPFTKCFSESSNIALIKIAEMLGDVRFESWIKRFGFGARTCPDLGGESAGLFRPLEKWSGYSMGSLPMGQEISVTMLQLTRAFSVIANGGYMVQPYLVDQVTDDAGSELYAYNPDPPDRIISGETAATMRALCHLVVTSGTGTEASIPEYRVGGKTGTAQMAKIGGGGYDKDRYTTVFAGFAPIADPRIAAAIVIQEPTIKQHYGGYVCGPVFREVVHHALRYLHVPEDPVLEPVVPGEHGDADPDALVAGFSDESWDALMEADWLDPEADMLAATAPEVVGPQLPNLTGMTKREALARLNELDIKWDVQGAGWVATQQPPPGTPLGDVSMCRLVFENRTETESHEAS